MKKVIFLQIKNSKQSGQATLEYILLLFIILAILTGTLMKFSQGFKKFGTALVGDQLRCALEYGQFPDQLPGGLCDTPEFDMGAGGKNAGSSSASSSNASGGGGNAKQDSGKSTVSDSSGSGGGGGADGGSLARGGSGGRRFASSNANSGGSSSAEKDSGDSETSAGTRKITVINETVRTGDSGDSRYIPVTGSEESKEENTKSGISAGTGGSSSKNNKKIPVNMEDRKPAEAPPDEPMSFAQFLKYLIIAAIIVALVVFFGSQVLNFQKSKE